jgi:hypothetical protein
MMGCLFYKPKPLHAAEKPTFFLPFLNQLQHKELENSEGYSKTEVKQKAVKK